MKKLHLLGVSVVTGVVMASAVAAPALAWHPKGQIKKYVQNVTTNGERADANDAASAVEAKTGDTLLYTIEINNAGKPDSRGYNDMHFTVLRDVLPVGVELEGDSTKRDITVNIGVIEAGETVVKEYRVKVTSDKDDEVITNKACFLGDSEVKDAPQAGCDDAVIKLDIPQVLPPETDEPEGKGEDKPAVKAAVTELPKTGFGSVAGVFAGTSGLGYLISRRKRQ